jgi:hypothetical protein
LPISIILRLIPIKFETLKSPTLRIEGVSEALPGQDQGEEGRDHCGYWTLQILKIRHGLKKGFSYI